ncbi:MAG TPA: Asp-tRNA(Asn)/Glu-tRNA(Gln) amidotransferase GatCAB subunit A, partial [Lachnospiraceae bacterium]|nr:Asp-tRNA(Asn)/Glu-tRNA(Gln) amidotransferase GatCAB subunit A [Lachnospiraceae bacterium]
MELLQMTALELGRKIKDKEVTAVEAAEASLAQIRKVEDTVHAYVTVDEEGALLRARQVQEKIEAGELAGPLAGVPVAVKDNMCT